MSEVTSSRLTGALQRLAAPAHEQRRWLEEIGTAPLLDELALEFDDALKSPEGEAVASRVPEKIRCLDEHLLSFSGPSYERLWKVDALTAPEWEEVRRLARNALRLLEGSGIAS